MLQWKNSRDYLILGLFLLPLLWINQRETHDWGGDFAQYIQQAINIAEFQEQVNHHYIYNEEHPMLGPELYPIGFPLILAPVIKLFGNNMEILIIYMNLWLILLGLAFFSVLKLYYKSLPSIAITLMLCYMPYLIIFKSEVMADLPFLFFALLSFRSYVKTGLSWQSAVLLIITCLIKPYGLSLLLAIALHKVYKWLKQGQNIQRKDIIYFILALVLPSLINKGFGVPSSFSAYLNNFSFGELWTTIGKNFALYYQPFDNYLLLIDPEFLLFGEVLSILLFALLYIGISFRLFLFGPGIIEFFVLVHLAILLFFPSQAQAPRYLLLVLPFLFILLYESFVIIQMRWEFLKNWPLYFLVALNLIFYFLNYPWINKQFSDPLPGPQLKSSNECFDYIKNNIPKDEHILFKKPRVLGLYTGIYSYSNEPYQSLQELENKFEQMNTRFFLTNHHNHNGALQEHWLPAHEKELKLIWSNEHFKLYQKF